MTRDEVEKALDTYVGLCGRANIADDDGRYVEATCLNKSADEIRARILAAFDALARPDPATDAAVKLAAWLLNTVIHLGPEGRALMVDDWTLSRWKLVEPAHPFGAAKLTSLGRQIVERG